jgi:hypothetical protein
MINKIWVGCLALFSFGLTAEAVAQDLKPLVGYTASTMRVQKVRTQMHINDALWKELPTLIPIGEPITYSHKVRHYHHVDIKGSEYLIVNDYSRTLSDKDFIARFISVTNPLNELAKLPSAMQANIKSGKISLGMSKAQVLMAFGHPAADDVKNIEANSWKYWIGSFDSMDVEFEQGVLVRIFGDEALIRGVVDGKLK